MTFLPVPVAPNAKSSSDFAPDTATSPFEPVIDLAEFGSTGPPDGIGFASERDRPGVVNQCLLPNGNRGLLGSQPSSFIIRGICERAVGPTYDALRPLDRWTAHSQRFWDSRPAVKQILGSL